MSEFESKHFSLHSLTDDAYAAIASDGGAAIANSGLIRLGGQVLVFDTFMTPQAALDLQRASVELFGRAPTLIVNSHYHNDHIWGNQVFTDSARIVSTIRTRELIATDGKEEYDYYAANSAKRLESIREEYREANESKRKELSFWISYYENLMEALPSLKVVMPDMTFEGRMEIHDGSLHRVELHSFDGAHTENDTVFHLHQDGIVFMSDLLFVGCHPYFADGDPLRLLDALRQIEKLDARRFIPGHGQVGSRDDLALMIGYVEYCLQIARELHQTGKADKEHIAALRVPEPFRDWGLSNFFPLNIQSLCEQVKGSTP